MSKVNYKRVIDYLNVQADRNFKYILTHKKFIETRIKEGFVMEDFKTVVDKMVIKWGRDPKMEQYLRPSTLFGNKMDGYLNLKIRVREKSKIEQFGEKANEWINSRGDKNADGNGFSKGSGNSQDSGVPGAGQGSSGGLVSEPSDPTNPRLPDGNKPYPED